MSREPFDESPSEPMPYQLRTTSSSASVAPASTVTVVCLMAERSPLPGLNVTRYFCDDEVTLPRRMSLRHCESMPGRWPTVGMISAFAFGVEYLPGVTGVTRLIDTGIDVVCVVALAAVFPEFRRYTTMTVP